MYHRNNNSTNLQSAECWMLSVAMDVECQESASAHIDYCLHLANTTRTHRLWQQHDPITLLSIFPKTVLNLEVKLS